MRTSYSETDVVELSRRSSLGLIGRMIYDWNRFWFHPTDPTTLGLVRITAGLLILYAHLCYSTDLQTLFGKDAWLNLEMATQGRKETPIFSPPEDWSDQGVQIDKGRYMWSMWFHVTDPTWMAILHTGVLAVIFLFTIGLCTRVTSVLAFILALSYIQRAPTTLFGMDTIMSVLLIYMMIGSSGAALSVDRLLERRRAARQGGQRQGFLAPATRLEPSVSANFALRLLQIHFCLIYFASGTSKLLGSAWWSGTAVWGTMANYEFSPLDNKIYDGLMLFLSQHRWLWELVMTSSVAFTLVLEIGFIFLVWNRRLRWVMLVGAVLLHMGIAVFMGLTMFSLMMLAMMLAFVPAETVHRLVRKAASRLPAVTMERLIGRVPQRESVKA